MKNSTKKTSAFFQMQVNPGMQPAFPILPMYMMHPETFPKPPQKRRKLVGVGDKNGGEKLRVFTRLKGFKAKESFVWKEITNRFGSEIKHGELLSIADVVATNAGIQLDRDAKRRKSVLIKWFEENWLQISPYLKYVILEDRKNQNNFIPNFGTNMIGTSNLSNTNNVNSMRPGITSCNPIPSNFAPFGNITNNTCNIMMPNLQNNMIWPNNTSMNLINSSFPIQNGSMTSSMMNINPSSINYNNSYSNDKVYDKSCNNKNNFNGNNVNSTKINQNVIGTIQMQNWIQTQPLNNSSSFTPMPGNTQMVIQNQTQQNQTRNKKASTKKSKKEKKEK